MTGDPDQDAHLDVGEVHELRLDESPTTGYQWVVDVDGPVEVLESQYVPASGGIGAAGVRRVRVRAAAAGTADVHLRLVRSWSGESADERTVRLHVREQ